MPLHRIPGPVWSAKNFLCGSGLVMSHQPLLYPIGLFVGGGGVLNLREKATGIYVVFQFQMSLKPRYIK